MLETIKTQIKREIYKRGDFLYVDSLNSFEINPEFQAIDLNYFERFFRNNKETIRARQENDLINSLMSGNKITLRGY